MEKVYENKLGEFRHRRLPFAYWNEGPPTDAVSLSCCTRYQALPALQDLTVKWDTAMTIVSFYAMWKDRGIHKVLREREIGSDDSDLVVLGCGFRSEKVRAGDTLADVEGWVEVSGKDVWGKAFLTEGSIRANGQWQESSLCMKRSPNAVDTWRVTVKWWREWGARSFKGWGGQGPWKAGRADEDFHAKQFLLYPLSFYLY